MCILRGYFIFLSVVTCFWSQALYAADQNAINATDEGNKLLSVTPPSVMDKALIPPSGDKHDFMSMGKYLWPNPNTPNGLPYIYKDGQTNPNWSTYGDMDNIKTMATAVHKLVKAYRFTHQEVYAKKAAEFLRVWFLNPATRMNPNARCGESDPGKQEGAPGGVMYTMDLDNLVDDIAALEQSPSWTQDEKQRLHAWFKQFLTWLLEDKIALKESANQNNHGSWYDVEVVSIALYLGDNALAKTVLEQSKQKRIASMIEPDGSQPAELKRTRALGYTLFSVASFIRLAAFGEKVGVDLWHYETPDGRSIRKAIDFLLPYMDEKRPWPYQQIVPLSEDERRWWKGLLRQVAEAYHDPKYDEAIKNLP